MGGMRRVLSGGIDRNLIDENTGKTYQGVKSTLSKKVKKWNYYWRQTLNNKNLEKYNSRIEEVVGVEIPVTCPWYGGTIDAIVKINGAYYIIDFKTSKNISFNYLVQVSAYMWIINNGYSPNLPMIDGIGIIRVDKSCYGRYEDLFLNNFVTAQRLSIEEYQRTFAAYVNSYYRSLNAEYMTDIYKNCSYNPVKFFKERNNGNW